MKTEWDSEVQKKIFYSDSENDVQKLSSLTNVKLKVEESKVYVKEISPGFFGLFAKQKIIQGEKIIDYAGEVITETQLELLMEQNPEIADAISSYLVDAVGKKVVRADRYIKEQANFARFCNLNTSGPNAEIWMNKKDILPYYRALHTIPAHWQILIDYGKKYDLNFEVQPINPAPAGYGLDHKYAYASTSLNLTTEEQVFFGLNSIKNENKVSIKIPKFLQKGYKKKISYTDAHLPILQITQRNPLVLDAASKITPLMWACFQGNFTKIERLIKLGVDVNSLSHEGKNALFFLILGKGKPERGLAVIEKFKDRKMIFNHLYGNNHNILNLAILAAEKNKEKRVYVENLAKDFLKIINETEGYMNIIWFCIHFNCFSSLSIVLKNIPSKVAKKSLADVILRKWLIKYCLENPSSEHVPVINTIFQKHKYRETTLADFKSKKNRLRLLSLTTDSPVKKLPILRKRKSLDQDKAALQSISKRVK